MMYRAPSAEKHCQAPVPAPAGSLPLGPAGGPPASGPFRCRGAWGVVALLILAFLPVRTSAQHDSSIFSLPISMDEVSITAARKGWDVEAFIRRVQTDTTFYKAFRSLRVLPWGSGNCIRIFNRDGSVRASYRSETVQMVRNGCRSMQTTDEAVTGDFYERDGGYRYYTAALYAYLFFTKGTVCGDNDIVAGTLSQRGTGQLEKAKYHLKQLVFNPGGRITGLPFMGNKASIFDPEVARKYDFKLRSVAYAGEECYLFQAVPKKEFADDVVYNELSTWFRKADYSILARDYSLSYKTLVYDFDVKMKVRCQPLAGRLLPVRVDYQGVWRMFGKGRERGAFVATFQYR